MPVQLKGVIFHLNKVGSIVKEKHCCQSWMASETLSTELHLPHGVPVL